MNHYQVYYYSRGIPNDIQLWDYIEMRPEGCGGQPAIKGTRIPLRVVLACLAAGDTPEQIIAEFPLLTPEAIRAVIAFAAQSALDDLPLLPAPILKE